ncbi:MbtH family NRPS accessory protein [Streptomyces sp. NPDC047028]|jgi:MbtH protein|uniref:MbtH family protein n=1 Tax=Streptomyces sp. NPDC047028 TaxID=3155793 RepID=UPI0033E1ED6D
MSGTPFEKPGAEYLALVNDEGQYSVWPAAADVPAGWRVDLAAAPRQAVLDHIDRHWTDARPASLRAADGQPGQ